MSLHSLSQIQKGLDRWEGENIEWMGEKSLNNSHLMTGFIPLGTEMDVSTYVIYLLTTPEPAPTPSEGRSPMIYL